MGKKAKKQALTSLEDFVALADNAANLSPSQAGLIAAAQHRASEDAINDIVDISDENTETKKPKRTAVFCQRSFWYETHDADGALRPGAPDENTWKKQVLCDTIKVAKQYGAWLVLIFHDKDVDNKKGKKKPLHAHFIMKTLNGRSMSVDDFVSIYKKVSGFDYTQYNSRLREHVQLVRNSQQAARYLIHISEKALSDKKHVYNVRDCFVFSRTGRTQQSPLEPIKGDDADAFMQKLFFSAADKANDADAAIPLTNAKEYIALLALMVRCGHITVDDAETLYMRNPLNLDNVGSAFEWAGIKKRMETARENYRDAVKKFYSRPDIHRALITVYIEGPGGAGKTALASALADQFRGGDPIYNVAASSKSMTFDPADSYDLERAVILNEARGDAFSVDQWCSMTDPRESAMTASRNKNRYWSPAFLVLTNSVPLEQFIYDMVTPELRELIKGKPELGIKDADRITNEEWEQFYTKNPNYSNKFLQVRRRIPVWIQLISGADGTKVRVSVLDIASNDARPHKAFLPPVTDMVAASLMDSSSVVFSYNLNDVPDADVPVRQKYEFDDMHAIEKRVRIDCCAWANHKFALCWIFDPDDNSASVSLVDSWDVTYDPYTWSFTHAATLGCAYINDVHNTDRLAEIYATFARLLSRTFSGDTPVSVSPCYVLVDEVTIPRLPTQDDYDRAFAVVKTAIEQFYIRNGLRRSRWALPPRFDLANTACPISPRGDIVLDLPDENWEQTDFDTGRTQEQKGK